MNAGWWPDPGGQPGQRYHDGQRWTEHFAPSPPHQQIAPLPRQEKSSGIALLLTILWPGGGHVYLGLTQKSIPYVVANAFGFFLAWWIITLPISLLIWLVTLCMTVGSVTYDTNFVNEALRRGHRING
jgi:hypothetical protein